MSLDSKKSIILGVEELIVKVVNNDITKREDLPECHTLKDMKFWQGADV